MKQNIFVENIKCGGCTNSIKKGLLEVENIENVEIEIETGEIKISGNQDFDMEKVKKQLKNMGYPEVGENNLLLKGKSFVSCAVGRMGNQD